MIMIDTDTVYIEQVGIIWGDMNSYVYKWNRDIQRECNDVISITEDK